jgi:uncharacterized membrane protein HdeD (DUF308 family)
MSSPEPVAGLSLDAAAEVYRAAAREAVGRFWLLYLVEGVLLVLAGLLAIVFPVFATQMAILAMGWLLVLSGLLQAISLLSARHSPTASLQLVSAALALLIGFLILRDPQQSVITVSLLFVIFFMIEGVSKLVWALTIRPMRGWLWVLLSGALGIALSVVLIANIAGVHPWLLALLVGAQLIGIGAAIGYLAWATRRGQPPLLS